MRPHRGGAIGVTGPVTGAAYGLPRSRLKVKPPMAVLAVLAGLGADAGNVAVRPDGYAGFRSGAVDDVQLGVWVARIATD
jgi:hypothetical protein